MTTQTAIFSNPDSGAVAAAARGFSAVLEGLRARWRAHRTRAALEQLDARTLRDIGIAYSDILVLTTHGTDAMVKTHQRVIHRLDRA